MVHCPRGTNCSRWARINSLPFLHGGRCKKSSTTETTMKVSNIVVVTSSRSKAIGSYGFMCKKHGHDYFGVMFPSGKRQVTPPRGSMELREMPTEWTWMNMKLLFVQVRPTSTPRRGDCSARKKIGDKRRDSTQKLHLLHLQSLIDHHPAWPTRHRTHHRRTSGNWLLLCKNFSFRSGR